MKTYSVSLNQQSPRPLEANAAMNPFVRQRVSGWDTASSGTLKSCQTKML